MNLLLNRLTTDHKYLQDIQACLKQQMHKHFELGEPLDLGILLDIMYYLRNYTDCFHHPLEDRIYQKMRCRIADDRIVEQLDGMEMEHAQLQLLTRRLQEDFMALEAGESVSNKKLWRDFQAYIQMTEAHIDCENEYLFPAIEKHLLQSDVAAIERSLGQYGEPDFETPVPAAVAG